MLKPNVTAQQRVEVGYRSTPTGQGRARDVIEESLMLTADENIVDIDFDAVWQVNPARPQDFVFNLQNPDGTIKSVAESAMREVIGRRNIQAILTTEQASVAQEVRQIMQETLDAYGAGVLINVVQLQAVQPPSEVRQAFFDVNAAQQDAVRVQNEAETFASRVVPEARGEAARTVQQAEAYREQSVADATGQAARFRQVYEEYRKAPDVSRERIFLETMERVYGGVDKIIVDQNGQGVVPFLPLNQPSLRPQPQGSRQPAGSHAMNSTTLRTGVLILLALAAIVLYSSVFIVQQTQYALVLRFGAVQSAISEPGLKFKLPLVDNVTYFDKRVLDLDLPVQTMLSADRQNLEVDAFTRYRIIDPLRFYQAVGNIALANQRLSSFTNSAMRNILASASRDAIVRTERADLMNRIQDDVNRQAASLGIEMIDVRLTRVDLPAANSQAVYQRMRTEREREAADLRANGQQQAQTIRARAEREATIIRAEANRQAEELRGQGDADRNRILAEAFGLDPEFFAFYRSMQAYETGLKGGDTRLVLSPNSDFFRYFNDPTGRRSRGRFPGSPLLRRLSRLQPNKP